MAIPRIDLDTFIIADPHFGHDRALVFEPCRAEAVSEGSFKTQNEMLTTNWNSVVTDNDTVLVLGDFAFKGIKESTALLNGKKLLIRGNHDRPTNHAYLDAGFTYVYDDIVAFDPLGNPWSLNVDNDPYMSALAIQVEGYGSIFFSHYPMDFYEDYYTKQRKQDLGARVANMSRISAMLGTRINIHGHTHSTIVDNTPTLNYLNVSCENLGFVPIRLRDLLEASGLKF